MNFNEVTIDSIFENVQKAIFERKSLREQVHKTILHLDENNSEPDEAGSCESEATSSGSKEISKNCHESKSQAITKKSH